MTTENHFIGKVTQKALIVHEGKILFSRDVVDPLFDLPGGRIHEGEQPREALAREMREELSVDVEVGDVVFVMTTLWGRSKTPHYFIAFETTLISPVEALQPDGTEVGEMRFVSEDELATLPVYQECVNAANAFWKHVRI